jgi:hypothetical protein
MHLVNGVQCDVSKSDQHENCLTLLKIIFLYFYSALLCFFTRRCAFFYFTLNIFRGCFRQKGFPGTGSTSKLVKSNRIHGLVERVINQPISNC